MNNHFDLDAFLEKMLETEDKIYSDKSTANVVPLDNACVGNLVTFGETVWRVIGVEDGKKLLISKDCDGMDMDWQLRDETKDDSSEPSWKTLSDIQDDSPINYAEEAEEIRKYFAEWYCNKFSAEERARMVPHTIITSTGKQEVNVFLLSRAEVEKYLPNKEERIASMHVIFNDVVRSWLLRTNDSEEYQLPVNTEGEFERVPDGYTLEWFRPAVWVR